MARPMTDGLLYFPLDVDFFSDKKIKSLRAHYGADGIALYLYLLCEIYRNSYYIKVDDDFIDCAAADLGLTVDKTRQIMKFFCKRSLFDDKLFMADTILTASSIQRRYQEARKGSKRDVFVDAKLWLLDKLDTLGFIKVRPVEVNSQKNDDFSEKNSDNSENNHTKQSKAKESKVNESNAGSSAPAAAFNTREMLVEKYGSSAVSEYESRFRKWQVKQGAVRIDMYEAIAKWMERDGVPLKSQSNSSIDVDEIVSDIMKSYQSK